MRRYTIIVALRPKPGVRGDVPGHEFLMMRNAKRGNRLELPGGAVEPAETPLIGARREFIEETGYDWSQPVLVQQRTGTLGEGFVFACGLGPRIGRPEANTAGLEWCQRLPAADLLSFPDDPYADLFAAVRRALANGPEAQPGP